MSVKNRIKEFVESKNITISSFEKSINASNGYVNSISKSIGLDKIESILEIYPKLNLEWLLTGNGSMIKGNKGYEIDKTLHTPRVAEPQSHYGNTIPLYDIEPTAGVSEIFAENPQSIPMDHITIPNLPKCDGAMHIRGDSMYPLLKSGDIVAYKVIHNTCNIIWGEMYLVYVSHEGDEYFFCKFLKKSSKEGYAEFISQNQHHQTVEFPLESIKALAMVKASIRFNTLF